MSRILLFIPMYNCEKQIPRVLSQIGSAAARYIERVLIVNNRSTDGGEEAVRRFLTERGLPCDAVLLRNCENYGLGGSHKVAFRYAMENGFDHVIVLHGDDQGHLEDLLPLLESGVYTQYDCLLGSRFIKGATLENYSAFRTFGNRVYNLLFSIVTGRRVYDLGAGLNLYAASMLESRFYMRFPDGLTFNYCMVLALAALKQSARFFPIRWSEDDQVSNVKLFRQACGVLGLLGQFAFGRKSFMRSEHRDTPRSEYAWEQLLSVPGKDGGCGK